MSEEDALRTYRLDELLGDAQDGLRLPTCPNPDCDVEPSLAHGACVVCGTEFDAEVTIRVE